ncbi:MAG: PIN domain-containing protein [Acidobacteria bacterium]|nr:PIN domain-containing protein [Acidobacteriota bacterium]
MIALDTSILVYARRAESPHHLEAKTLVEQLANGSRSWALPWPCVYEFLKVVTHRAVFKIPTPLPRALSDLAMLLSSPSVSLLGQGPAHWDTLSAVLGRSESTGSQIYDGSIAALCLEHGVDEIWTVNTKHFQKFTSLRCHNPFA